MDGLINDNKAFYGLATVLQLLWVVSVAKQQGVIVYIQQVFTLNDFIGEHNGAHHSPTETISGRALIAKAIAWNDNMVQFNQDAVGNRDT